MSGKETFIEAYHAFRGSVDLDTGGRLPELNDLVWCLLMGIPEVPADQDRTPEAPFRAIDQRAAILKAVFVEANAHASEAFIDQGLTRYDEACHVAKDFLREVEADSQ
jgi:hypothetical protein